MCYSIIYLPFVCKRFFLILPSRFLFLSRLMYRSVQFWLVPYLFESKFFSILILFLHRKLVSLNHLKREIVIETPESSNLMRKLFDWSFFFCNCKFVSFPPTNVEYCHVPIKIFLNNFLHVTRELICNIWSTISNWIDFNGNRILNF